MTEEIDSYLYQTVGQDGLHFIAEALELPLYRRTIHGTAVDQGSDYASTSQGRARGHIEGDETEDLYDLLQQVLVGFLHVICLVTVTDYIASSNIRLPIPTCRVCQLVLSSPTISESG